MSNIKGTLIKLKDFLFNNDTSIKIEYKGEPIGIIDLKKDRRYIIPDYQREIRWQSSTIFSLIKDIYHGAKFLGNIILSKNNDVYEIIDGQQRIAALNMAINYIKKVYGNPINDIDDLVHLELNCFDKSDLFIRNGCSFDGLSTDECSEIKSSDKYKQIEVLKDLYNSIEKTGLLNTVSTARTFINNLYECQFNVVLSNDNDRNICTQYYIDVNLKGIKLDTEDIFKGYLFSQDSNNSIREAWVTLKSKWFEFNERTSRNQSSTVYPLMKIISHYINSCILSKNEYNAISIDDEFLIQNDNVTINGDKYYKGEHIIKVINNNELMLKAINDTREYIQFMIDIVGVDGVSDNIKRLFNKLDNKEIKIISNFIKKMILDNKLKVPKGLVLKYYFEIVKKEHSKDMLRQIYAVYMFNGLFFLFGNTKKTESIINILKSESYYIKLVDEVKNFFEQNNLLTSNFKAIISANSNTTKEDIQYKCKTLATLYNYFKIKNNKVSLNGDINQILEYLNNSEKFSVEHLIINKSGKTKFLLNNGNVEEIELSEPIKMYNNYVFNFIFIPRTINGDELEDFNLEYKLNELESKMDQIKCEYSKLVIGLLKSIFRDSNDRKYENKVDLERALKIYFQVDFKEKYNEYVSKLVDKLIIRFAQNG